MKKKKERSETDKAETGGKVGTENKAFDAEKGENKVKRVPSCKAAPLYYSVRPSVFTCIHISHKHSSACRSWVKPVGYISYDLPF